MKKPMLCLILGPILILLSTPLAYTSVNVVYHNKNLTGEFVPILNGFIHSFMLIGTLIFIAGLLRIMRNQKTAM
ncbi:glycosyl transferase [Neobacillus sp. NPDC093182]|uniref:glycosyl transferase n=1 Tax=Neobacillus sp. NPDC093182 TaxID=3364297 RepID=UPI0037F2B0C1